MNVHTRVLFTDDLKRYLLIKYAEKPFPCEFSEQDLYTNIENDIRDYEVGELDITVKTPSNAGEHRENMRMDKLIKNAGFYTLKAFEDFRFDEVTLPETISLEYLKNCEFSNTKTNLLMYGNVGTGKTFLSTALGIEACKKGINTKFFRTAALVNKLSEAKKSGTLTAFMKKISRAEILIFDEWVRSTR